MFTTAASSPRGSNSPSPMPYHSSAVPLGSRAGPSSGKTVHDADMDDLSNVADMSSNSHLSVPRHPPPPASPSSTSLSDDGGQDFADLASVEESKPSQPQTASTSRLSRRGTLIPNQPSSNSIWTLANNQPNTASNLPHEILLHIFKYVVPFPPDLLSCLQVSKSWCICGVELLWHRPSFYRISSLFKLIAVIRKPDQLFPYADFVRRLNFTILSHQLEDQLFLMMSACTRLERLTLAGCSHISDETLVKVFQETKQLVAVDFTDLGNLTDATLLTLAQNCPKIQGINLTGCKQITSTGVVALAQASRLLRRVKLCGCEKVGDDALIALTQNCPALLEVDLVNCPEISDKSVQEIWKHSYQMRELRLGHCGELTDRAFPSSQVNEPLLTESASGAVSASLPVPVVSHRMFDHLRILDLTNCNSISDDTVRGIVANVPRLKNLALTKCTRLTDESLYSIARLGKNLHYLHLGHVSNITDRAVTHLARACTRLRYIDVACCPNLTDLSVTEIANNMPKLRRIGLVKVVNLTDQAIYGLVDRYTSLERIHLSYCENVSVPAIFCVLQRLPRLTHLSLTGVPAFRRAELQAMCRPPPKDFNEHQRQAFCVYSGKGVNDLRKYLQRVYTDEQLAAQFGQLEPRVRVAFANMSTDGAARSGTADTRRVQLSPGEQMYYEQQRQIARMANSRRATEDTQRLNHPTATDSFNQQILVDAQEQRNPGAPLIATTSNNGRYGQPTSARPRYTTSSHHNVEEPMDDDDMDSDGDDIPDTSARVTTPNATDAGSQLTPEEIQHLLRLGRSPSQQNVDVDNVDRAQIRALRQDRFGP